MNAVARYRKRCGALVWIAFRYLKITPYLDEATLQILSLEEKAIHQPQRKEVIDHFDKD